MKSTNEAYIPTNDTPIPVNDYGRQVLDLVALMGETLLLNGAEISRVQTTMELVSKAYNKDDIDVYAISNGIFVTLRHDDKTRCTHIKHVPLATPNLGRVTQINALSRKIVEQDLPLQDAMDEMQAICRVPAFPLWLQIIACALGSSCFCYLFGGSVLDFFAAAPVGILLCFAQYAMANAKLSKMIQTILGSALVTLCGAIIAQFFPVLHMDRIIIGGLIILVPGVPFTTSIRDFFNGDYLSGTIRLIDALLVALCMAIGVGAVYYIFI